VAKRRNAHWNRTSECRPPTSEGLMRQQRRLCARNLDLMPAVVHSARQMAQVCQETFYESRWNCSSVLLAPNFMPDLTGGLCSASCSIVNVVSTVTAVILADISHDPRHRMIHPDYLIAIVKQYFAEMGKHIWYRKLRLSVCAWCLLVYSRSRLFSYSKISVS